ncbi:hypothetical protein DPMN_011691 [Dreissena polymorpha]|uniref:Uncharacterized protein n=1 Tax=Dreissena polymorpha TaxID=45954 RepID=A0A9D4N119_DREPO|nr:hypothetical protein DPMN_011691 [Dreissena polymorpha]
MIILRPITCSLITIINNHLPSLHHYILFLDIPTTTTDCSPAGVPYVWSLVGPVEAVCVLLELRDHWNWAEESGVYPHRAASSKSHAKLLLPSGKRVENLNKMLK